MKTFGVWCTRPTAADIRLARDLGFDRLDIMVGDESKQRDPIPFAMEKPVEFYVAATRCALDLGFREVHFTAWAMPHVTYMAYAGDQLQHLCGLAGAHGIVLDAEEPFTLATKPDYGSASSCFFAQAKGCRVGITGIGYANFDKLEPLCRNADYLIPQCYSTNTSKVLPQNVGKLAKHWAKRFPSKPIVPGLAAYRQSGIAGHTTKSALRAARDAVGEHDTVIYWSLRQIKGSVLVRETLRRMIADLRTSEENVA